jgi:hypothetical protein
MAGKISTYQSAVPTPVVFSVSGRVYAHETTTGLDVSFHGDLLVDVEYVAGCIKKYDSRIIFQAAVSEHVCISAGVDLDAICRTKRLQSGHAFWNGFMYKAAGFCKHQYSGGTTIRFAGSEEKGCGKSKDEKGGKFHIGDQALKYVGETDVMLRFFAYPEYSQRQDNRSFQQEYHLTHKFGA